MQCLTFERDCSNDLRTAEGPVLKSTIKYRRVNPSHHRRISPFLSLPNGTAKLGSDPVLLPLETRIHDGSTSFLFIVINLSRVNVVKSDIDTLGHLLLGAIQRNLPRPEANLYQKSKTFVAQCQT